MKTAMQSPGKGDVRYWQKRVRRSRSVRRGHVTENAFYSVKLQHAGRRMEVSLGSPNKFEAAAKAKECYFYLLANGWLAFLERFRPEKAPPKANQLTLGQFLAAVRSDSDLSARTINAYAGCFRRIVAEIAGVPTPKAPRFESATWRKRVDAVPLASITPDKIRAWKRRYINSMDAQGNALAARSRAIGADSYIRQARSLFSPRKVLSKINLELPTPLPFDGIPIVQFNNKFYGSLDPRALLRDALAELPPEQLKSFVLALSLGLRRAEIDWLEWSSFDFSAGSLTIRPTKWHALKTHESAATLPVEPEILELFRGWRARASSEFVIESPSQPKVVSYPWWRCEPIFDSLVVWLRHKGLSGSKPLHTLRKMFGAELCTRYGIHAASLGLRHANINVTAGFYVDSRPTATPGFGAEISGAVVPFPPPVPGFAPSQSDNPDRAVS